MRSKSLPLRECGLKSFSGEVGIICIPSLPLRECGLKYCKKGADVSSLGHSPCGSVDWNIYGSPPMRNCPLSLPLRECGLKLLSFHIWPVPLSHSPCGSVDWNNKKDFAIRGIIESLPLRECGLKYQWKRRKRNKAGHSPCGSVDWNDITYGQCFVERVTPLAGVWIEILQEQGLFEDIVSLPLRECGLKSFYPHPLFE